MVEWRRHLHAHPELSFEEHETTAFVCDLLRGWGIAPQTPLATGAVASIEGSAPGPTVALRADIDALPIHEQNEFEFASRLSSCMHACGHDGHTAILLGVAKVLSSIRTSLKGTVRLLFQPAEERLGGGAQGLIAAGVLGGVHCILGLHLWSGLDTGCIAARDGPVMASTDEFRVRIRGRGGHGALPHETIDALMAGAQIVCDLQTVVSRRVDPLAPAVVTVGTFHAGTAFNVIPGEASLTGTVRALSEDVRGLIRQEIERIVTHGARAFGAEPEYIYVEGNPVLVNDAAVVKLVAGAAASVLGDSKVVAIPPLMAGDDFAFYAQRVPAAFIFVGTRNSTVGSVYPHHHPRFTIDEASLRVGAQVLLASLEQLQTRRAPLGQALGEEHL